MTETGAEMSLRDQVSTHLRVLYGDRVDDGLVDTVIGAFGIADTADHVAGSPTFSADEVILITYGDSLIGGDHDDRLPLTVLGGFVDEKLADVVSGVHILPFFPASSDGGFSVVDYNEVAPALGDWASVGAVAGGSASRPSLMADLILNHGSAQSEWFQQFRRGEKPGRDYYLTADPDADLRSVVRPRTHPLLQAVDTPDGKRHVWCTFSFDQVDFDFGNPDVLVEFCRIVDLYVRQGVTRLRLDAVAYVWKEIGTSSIHLAETHEIVKLFNTLLSVRAPEVMLITETNVPHDENVSYFGDGDEAHVVYNFSLVPLVLHTMLRGDSTALGDWTRALDMPGPGMSFLNFLASHDGMGVRPAEGLLTLEEIDGLVDAARTAGGTFSPYSTPDGERPYELNVSLADLLGRRDLSLADRYVCAHAIMLAFAGIPAIYIHSLLATPGDIAAVRTTGVRRNINRSQLVHSEIRTELADPDSPQAAVFERLSHLIRVRRGCAAFAPHAAQELLDLGPGIYGLQRTSTDGTQRVACLLYTSPSPRDLSTSRMPSSA